jgi:hypothetical protein
MTRSLALVSALFVFTGFTAADDKKDKALSGTWTREANGLDIKVEFVGKDTVKMSASADADNGVTVTCKFKQTDGAVKAKVTKVEVKGDFKNAPKEGLEISFKWKVKGDTATLDDLEGEGLENAKPVVEGEYAKKK